ncbi:helix-turn-helix transcriptional regulator [Burkholderia gladioli]|uniref:helix-turn-helix transcriptional regulator n=1 Tax=Burkholderia gladioli TaxID=28095 RepID=UPI001641F7AE|nr:helix-turn-helix transcriptional regulator [Burkholderia gladioli]
MHDRIAKLGRLISNVGSNRFLPAMQSLVNGTVAIDAMDVLVWHVDPHRGELLDPSTDGGAKEAHAGILGRLPEALLEHILDPHGPQLIHLCPRHLEAGGDTIAPAYRCIMRMRRARRWFVICLQRDLSHGDFRPDELVSLDTLSRALLPLVEQHASTQSEGAAGQPEPEPAAIAPLPAEQSADALPLRFRERLREQNITLSSREEQVCVLILSGYTLPAISEALALRVGTIETYLKRVRIKLGVSGRHGLSRWMIE